MSEDQHYTPEELALEFSKSLTPGERQRLRIEARKDQKMERLGKGRRNEKR